MTARCTYPNTWLGRLKHKARRGWHVRRGHSLLMHSMGANRHYTCTCGDRWARA